MCASGLWVLRSLCHTQLQKKYFYWNISAKNISAKNIYDKNIFTEKDFWENILEKIFSPKIFSPKIFSIFFFLFLPKIHLNFFNDFKTNKKNMFARNISPKNTLAKYISKKKGAKPLCCPQGLGWYRAIARSQPSIQYIIIYCLQKRLK